MNLKKSFVSNVQTICIAGRLVFPHRCAICGDEDQLSWQRVPVEYKHLVREEVEWHLASYTVKSWFKKADMSFEYPVCKTCLAIWNASTQVSITKRQEKCLFVLPILGLASGFAIALMRVVPTDLSLSISQLWTLNWVLLPGILCFAGLLALFAASGLMRSLQLRRFWREHAEAHRRFQRCGTPDRVVRFWSVELTPEFYALLRATDPDPAEAASRGALVFSWLIHSPEYAESFRRENQARLR